MSPSHHPLSTTDIDDANVSNAYNVATYDVGAYDVDAYKVEPLPNLRGFDLKESKRLMRYLGIGIIILLFGAILLNTQFGVEYAPFPESWNLGLRQPIDQFKSWVIGNRTTHPLFTLFFDPISDTIDLLLRALEAFLLALPWSVVAVALFFVAYRTAGRNVALFSVAGLILIGLFGLWEPSMQTFALIGVSVAISLLLGIPLGILAARSDRFNRLLRPLLDAMQTMPAFVYLIPVLLFFGIARVPSVVATIIYALPPAVRLTNLGIRQVPESALEAAEMFGSTPGQKLRKVQLPLAMPSILLGVNQTIMMALGIVVIAALIGAGGLGLEVLTALRSLRVGQGLEAGLAIVLMAIIFDRISYGLSRNSSAALGEEPPQHDAFRKKFSQVNALLYNYTYWSTALTIMLVFAMLYLYGLRALGEFPDWMQLSIRGPVDASVVWMRDNLYQIGNLPIGTGPLSDFLVIRLLNPLRTLLRTWLPWPLIIVAFSFVAYAVKDLRLALLTALCLFTTGLLGLWSESMDTLSQVLVAVLISVAVGIPCGIWAAKSASAEKIIRPTMDLLQTIPPFVYLVPVIMLFKVGRVPGVIASVLYALPPIVRLTSLGIRQVAQNAIEAADMFGSTPRQKLLKVELPLARASIMAGINQTVMMVLAMVIIAGLVGGGALGHEAVTGLAKSQLGRGIEAGLAIVLLAVVLDRITQALGEE